jgi:ABC-type transporter Mla MlaB component
MAKDDTAPGGIFSKVAKFVRNPGTNWSDLDQKASNNESSYSKQALKEMIERKRRNDFVRKREFDMLRKLRRREAMGGAPGSGDGSARPSFFQSSMPSKPDDRAMTLKKIDEIEAQMSMQWWKTKHGAGAGAASSMPGSVSSFPNSDMLAPQRPKQQRIDPAQPNPAMMAGSPSSINNTDAYAATAPDDLNNALAMSVAKASAAVQAAGLVRSNPSANNSANNFAKSPDMATAPAARAPLPPMEFTAPAAPPLTSPPTPSFAPAPASKAASSPAAAPAPVARPPMMGSMASYDGNSTTGFSASKMFAMEVIDEVQHDPELEEAAIRFANGDDAGAEAGLLEALSPRGGRAEHEETWFAAFDLYRATGQHDRFESLAIDFAGKFNRSAPAWFSMPDQVDQTANPDAIKSTEMVAHKSHWRAPGNIGVQSMAALNAALVKATAPWILDWSIFKTIDEAAVVPLTKLFAAWAAQPVQLRFMSADVLEQVLRNATPSDARDVSQDLWKLRLEYLRITHRPDEFELAALDFCVTYELSPPAWESARCEYKTLDAQGMSGIGQTIIGEAVHDSVMSELSGFDDSQMHSQSSMQRAQLSAVELSGQIHGDPVGVLERLEARMAGADVMVISCAKLMRVDFSAAGTLLNWVSARQSEGRIVQFTDVHRLVAAFFHVIGISEHSKVSTRKD